MRRLLVLLGTIFSTLAAGCLVACAITTTDAVRFRSAAERTRGVIVDVRSHTDCDNAGCDELYRPVIRFNTRSGQQITFTPNGSSSRQPQVGATVTVFYPEQRPQDARVDGLLDFWLAPLVTGVVGLMMAAAGVPMLVIQLRRRRTEAWLAGSGRRITADIAAVRLNRHLRINGAHPWQLSATWSDPATGRRYSFRSENVLADPRDRLGDRSTVEVLIDPANPGGRYRVELPTGME